MARYTLKTFYGQVQLESYAMRKPSSLSQILNQSSSSNPGPIDPWGQPQSHITRIQVLDPINNTIYDGNVSEGTAFIKKLI